MQWLHGGDAGVLLVAAIPALYLTGRKQGAHFRGTLETEETEMSVYSTNRNDTVRFGGFFGTMVAAFAAWNDTRVTRSALSRLTDRELDDIGLTRADIDTVTSN
jgi:uncharacterized protein YjiS (DUF1127 family)